MDWAQLGNLITSGGIAVSGAVFAATYLVVARWWESPVGRHIMALTAAVALFGAYTVLIWFWPHGTPATVLRSCRIAIGLTMTVLLIRQTRLLVRTQREGRAREKTAPDEPPTA